MSEKHKTASNLPENSSDDPHLQRIRRKLVRLMLSSIIITFVLVGAVLLAVIYKIMQSSNPALDEIPNLLTKSQSALQPQIELGNDSHIKSYRLSGDVIVLQSSSPTKGDELIFYNYRLNHIISRLKFTNNVFAP